MRASARSRSPPASAGRRPTGRAGRDASWCQSVAAPPRAEYWHIGAMTMRFSSWRSSRRKGSNRRAGIKGSGSGPVGHLGHARPGQPPRRIGKPSSARRPPMFPPEERGMRAMGLLVDGQWRDQGYDTAKTGGRFERSASAFRNWVTADGRPGPRARAASGASRGAITSPSRSPALGPPHPDRARAQRPRRGDRRFGGLTLHA